MRDAQGSISLTISKLDTAVIRQGDEVCFTHAVRPDKQRVIRTWCFPKLLNALHDGLQNWLTRDKCALEKILGHEGRGKASKRETSHRRSQAPFLRAQMYCSAGYRQRTERPRRSK